jgi:biotin carboxyl carrier protein
VWAVLAEEGATVAEGDKLLILESMKMETAIVAPCAGHVTRVLVAPGQIVEPGQTLVVLAD